MAPETDLNDNTEYVSKQSRFNILEINPSRSYVLYSENDTLYEFDKEPVSIKNSRENQVQSLKRQG